MPEKRIHVIFRGRVQGVGFRFTAMRTARHFDVTGYVRNCPDGTVEMVAEGEEAEVRRFVNAVRQRMGGHIHDSSEQCMDASGEFAFFDVRY